MTNLFDDRAATWDEDPEKVGRAGRVADAIADAIPLTGDDRVLSTLR